MSAEDLAARVHRLLTMTASSWETHADEFDELDSAGAQAWRSAAEELREVRDRLAALPPPAPRRWDPQTPAGVLDENDHRDRVAQSSGQEIDVWCREPAGCWHLPVSTEHTGPCRRHCGQSLRELSKMGYRLRFVDEPETHR